MNLKFKDRKGNFHIKPSERDVCERISVYGIAKRNNKILLVKPVWKDEFELPGGGVRKREAIHDGLKREFLEETGFSIKILTDTPVKIKRELFYADDIDKYYNSQLLFFLVEVVGNKTPEIVKEQEIKEIRWCGLNVLENRAINSLHSGVLKELVNYNSEEK